MATDATTAAATPSSATGATTVNTTSNFLLGDLNAVVAGGFAGILQGNLLIGQQSYMDNSRMSQYAQLSFIRDMLNPDTNTPALFAALNTGHNTPNPYLAIPK